MATDRELLELAAKAAGMDGYEYNDGYTNAYYAGSKFYMTKPGSHTPWNPLSSDGDALRLAVNLGLLMKKSVIESLAFCDEAGTRRAFVSAAAAIGRSL